MNWTSYTSIDSFLDLWTLNQNLTGSFFSLSLVLLVFFATVILLRNNKTGIPLACLVCFTISLILSSLNMLSQSVSMFFLMGLALSGLYISLKK